MKRNPFITISVILGLLLIIISNPGFAQFNNFGFTYGVNFAKWNGDADNFANDLSEGMKEEGFTGIDYESKTRNGVSFGMYYEYMFNKRLMIRPELNYTMKGTKFRHDGPVTFNYDYETYYLDLKQDLILVTNYIELPVLMRFNFVNNDKNTVPYVIAGPNISYLVTSKMKVKTEVDDDKDTSNEEYDKFNKFDWGLYGGVGISFMNTMLIELRYNYNFLPVLEEEYNDGYLMYNSMICINLLIGLSNDN